jgi:hypothetical protein
MSLAAKALEMRNAIDGVELALSGIGNFEAFAGLWENSREDIRISWLITVGNIRQLRHAYDELNRIVNSPEFTPANLAE